MSSLGPGKRMIKGTKEILSLIYFTHFTVLGHACKQMLHKFTTEKHQEKWILDAGWGNNQRVYSSQVYVPSE